MTRRIRLAVVLFAFFFSVPSFAHAGILEWIDQMSGPGPYLGLSVEARLYCFPTDKPSDIGVLSKCLNRLPENKRRSVTINFGVGVAWALANHLPYASSTADKGVTLVTFDPSIWWYPTPPVAVGFGGGVYKISGPAFETFYRGYVKPVQVEIKPFAFPHKRWGTKAEIFTIRAGYTLIPKGVEAKDFGAIGPFKTGHEVLPTISVLLDIESLKFLRF